MKKVATFLACVETKLSTPRINNTTGTIPLPFTTQQIRTLCFPTFTSIRKFGMGKMDSEKPPHQTSRPDSIFVCRNFLIQKLRIFKIFLLDLLSRPTEQSIPPPTH